MLLSTPTCSVMLDAVLTTKKLRTIAAGLALLLNVAPSGGAPAVQGATPDRDVPTRALWVVRTTLSSREAVATMVRTAREAGFNTLLVQVRGRADAYYAAGLEPRPSLLDAQPSFDPLAETISRAHGAGLQVHAWVNVNLVSNASELPAARNHVIYRHPEWLMVPLALADELAGIDPRSPAYVGRLARYVRGQPNELEGMYLSPIPAASADYTVAVVRDIVSRYGVDGVHLDYVRYPNEDFDYSREALAAFRQSVVPDLAAADRQKYDVRLAQEPTIYSRAYPERWRRFRHERLTSLVVKIRDAVKATRPAAVLSAAVVPDPGEAASRKLQPWSSWIAAGLLDVVCPMVYTTDPATFAAQVGHARSILPGYRLWAGIGAFQLSPAQIASNVHAARHLGADGVILFSYDSLTDPARGPEYLALVGRAAFMQ